MTHSGEKLAILNHYARELLDFATCAGLPSGDHIFGSLSHPPSLPSFLPRKKSLFNNATMGTRTLQRTQNKGGLGKWMGQLFQQFLPWLAIDALMQPGGAMIYWAHVAPNGLHFSNRGTCKNKFGPKFRLQSIAQGAQCCKIAKCRPKWLWRPKN